MSTQASEPSTLHLVRRAIGANTGAFVRIAATALGIGVLEAIFLILVTRLTVGLSEGRDHVNIPGIGDLSVLQIVGLGGLAVLLRLLLGVINAAQGAQLLSGYTAQLRLDLADAWLHATYPVQFEDSEGRLQELLGGFSQRGSNLLSYIGTAVVSAVSLVALLALAVVVDPVSSLVVFVALAILGLAIRPLRRAAHRAGRRSATRSVVYAERLAEVSQVGLEMHSFRTQGQMGSQLRSLIDEQARLAKQVTYIGQLVPTVYMSVAYLTMLCAIGAASALDQVEFDSFGAVLLLMLRALSYGQALQTAGANASSVLPFVEQLDEKVSALNLARREAPTAHLPSGQLGVCLSDVSYSYIEARPALREINLNIEPGSFVGVIGPSGGGKSTLLQLILGLREPNIGVVTIGGIEPTKAARDSLAESVAFVPQRPRLIDGSVSDNVRFLRPWITADQIEQSCRMANIHDEIVGWDDGYDHPCGPAGKALSGGQQQRLTLARALAGSPRLLILDEPTSALDGPSEAKIRTALASLSGQITMIVVAHRLSTLEMCDYMAIVSEGELRAFGVPRDLVNDPFYRDALDASDLS